MNSKPYHSLKRVLPKVKLQFFEHLKHPTIGKTQEETTTPKIWKKFKKLSEKSGS